MFPIRTSQSWPSPGNYIASRQPTPDGLSPRYPSAAPPRPTARSRPHLRCSASDRRTDDYGTAQSRLAPPTAASRNTSRGWTRLASIVQTDSTAVFNTRCLVSSQYDTDCSTGRAPWPGSRYDATSRGYPSWNRRSGWRTSVRRPSSTAASTCAALAAPIPSGGAGRPGTVASAGVCHPQPPAHN